MPEIDGKIIIQYHKALLFNSIKLDYIMKKRGITKQTIKKFLIGYDNKTDRFTIPIKDSLGNFVNIRKWKDKKPKMISYAEGYGEARLFPIENLKHTKIIICEGEWDCILLNQYGFNAITNTTGASTWKSEWNKYFENKNVVIIFDCDKAGRNGAKKVKDELMQYAKAIKIVNLGLEDGEDISDWFLKYKKDDKELIRLIKETPVEDMYELIDLASSMEAKYYDKKIKFYGLVIGKDLSPYLIPKRVKARCILGPIDGNKRCEFCKLKNSIYIEKEYNFNDNKDLLVKMINANDLQLEGLIRQDLHLPPGRSCPGKYEIEILERQNIEDIRIIPEINFEMINQEYVIRKCFYFGLGIQTNQDYLMKGTTWVDPTSQMGIHLIVKAEAARDNVSKFRLTEEIKKQLEIFRPSNPADVKSIKEKLKDIYTDFTYNITKMYERHNILMAVDLVYHSVLNFKFLGNHIRKGWLECAIFGDTKCGKTETIENIVRHYKAGEFVTSGENTTRAGLLGGAQQTHNGRWTVTWGKLPLNDRRLVVIDEADKLSEGIIDLLSGVRSSGIAELVFIHSQKTMARTRIVWVFNPKYGRMSEYNYGIEVLRETFGKQQDISRVDFAVAVSGDDVSDDIINIRHKEKYEHKYLSEYCHNSVMFAWSRQSKNIKFTKEAEDAILDFAKNFGKIYSPEIPLVVGAEMRIKLARLAIALATRLYNTDETGENVIVLPEHVVVIAEFLYNQYNSNIMGYKDFSDQREREKRIGNTSKIDKFLNDEETINLLLDMNRFQLGDLEDIFGLDRKETKELIADLRKNRILKRVHTFYKKTPAFIKYLKKKKDELKKLI